MSEEVKREVQTWDPVEWLDRIINGEQTYTLQEVPGNSGHYKLGSRQRRSYPEGYTTFTVQA